MTAIQALRDPRQWFQLLRFSVVGASGYVVNLAFSFGLLELLVTTADVPEVAAQAIAIVCATPLSFLGNRLWSFKH